MIQILPWSSILSPPLKKKQVSIFKTAWITEETYLPNETYRLLLGHLSIAKPITVDKVQTHELKVSKCSFLWKIVALLSEAQAEGIDESNRYPVSTQYLVDQWGHTWCKNLFYKCHHS